MRPTLACLFGLLGLYACDAGGTTPTPDGGVRVDAGPPRDGGGGGTDAGDVDGGGGVDAGRVDGGGGPVDGGRDAGMMMGCGGARPDISGITGAEGLVIARDGTIYYSQNAAVGRLVPGGSPENSFVRVGGRGTVWGLALDAANETLFVGVPGTGVISVDLTAATPMATTAVSGGSPNGLTMGADGALYYSDFGANHVYRLVPGGRPTQVTRSMIPSANGVVFLPDGRLLVASYSDGVLFALTLTAGAETGRTTFATLAGRFAPDGLALDADGRVYVTNNAGGTLVRLEADGSAPMTLGTGIAAAASIEFGAGPLDCEDIYVASNRGVLFRYEMGTVAGAMVPWH